MPPEVRKIKLVIGYDGTAFSGWQRQRHNRTIQGEIEEVLHRITREPISLHGAGRTDAGVHAEGMVAHFTTLSIISCGDFLRALNSILPGAIRIYSADTVEADFHARFSATGKRYRYKIYTGQVQPPHLRLYTLHVRGELNLQNIESCLQALTGTHDFSSFENSGSREKSNACSRGAVRTIFAAELHQENPEQFSLQFTGDGFLRNMVRNLVGTLLEAGKNKMTAEEFAAILQAKDRSAGGPTAPAHGLFLEKVYYN